MGRRIAIVVLMVTCACGGSSEDSGAPAGTTTPAGQATVSALPGQGTGPSSSVIAARFEFVDYTVAGGIAGVNDHLKVYPDGRAVYDDGVRVVNFMVTLQLVGELRAALERADIASLPPVAGAPVGADMRVYRVIFGGRAVRFDDATVPESLRPALAILDREVARAKSQR